MELSWKCNKKCELKFFVIYIYDSCNVAAFISRPPEVNADVIAAEFVAHSVKTLTFHTNPGTELEM